MRAVTDGPRIAVLDWAMYETLAELGQSPVAVAELRSLRGVTAMPPAAGVADLGLRGGPNLEALAQVAPDLILSSNFYAFLAGPLARIAPVFAPDLFLAGKPVLPRVLNALESLAERLGDPAAGHRARRRIEAAFDGAAGRVAADGRPVLLATIGDARHVQVFGTDSLYGGVLPRLGLRNAWEGRTAFGFNAPVPLSRLLDFPEARLAVLGPVPQGAKRALAHGALWQALPMVRAGRVLHLPEAANPYGGAPSALRLAQGLAARPERGLGE